ncbi:hypothetical protein MMC06_003337 [Schaereria dolodes]|nr:hypothetical protein [Schaereria dolodes]
MTAALNIGFMALTLIPLALDFFPKPYQASTVVRVGAGLTQAGDGKSSTGGNVPNIALFDPNGARLGFMSGTRKGKINEGNYNDMTVNHIDSSNNDAAEYISVSSGGTDALCIAYLAITWASGDKFQFFGDVGQQCGLPWYPSNLPVPTNIDPEYKPSCIWVGTNDNFANGFHFHVPDFGSNQNRAQGYQAAPRTMCQSAPRFSIWPKLNELNCVPVFDPPVPYNLDGTDPTDISRVMVAGKVECAPGPNTPPSSKQIDQLEQWHHGSGCMSGFNNPTYGVKNKRCKAKRDEPSCKDTRVVISDHMSHSAADVCKSATSRGPDFVSTKEGKYCDMCTHELWNVCAKKTDTGCFDLDTKKMRAGIRVHGRDLDDRSVPDKDYTETIHWT